MLPSLSFAAFVFWLLAVPMNGPLLDAAGIADASGFFLIPHILSLVLIGTFISGDTFKKLAPTCVATTILLSMALPLSTAAAPWLLMFLSVCGAFVAVDATTRLHNAKSPVLSAASGLVLGNLLFFILHLGPKGEFLPFALVSLPLLLLLFSTQGTTPHKPTFPSARLLHYLPFVLVFHIVSGLMYSAIYPVYHPAALFPGAELPFYMLTALGAVWLVKKHRELALIFGILLGMAAFAALQHGQLLSINLSMFAMQAGQGFVDLFLLAYLLSFVQRIRAVGLGLATLCLGIYCGQLIGQNMHEFVGAIVMTGHIALNLAVLTLYFLGRRRDYIDPPAPSPEIRAQSVHLPAYHLQPALVPVPIQNLSLPQENLDPPLEERLPENLRLLLSQRECLVLAHSLDGRPYRIIAADLNISESSVKTYMKRICDKLGVQGRKGLFDILEAK
ncbi:regulatory protein, luxR family [Geoalkalibacter ferrihydriticus]|uniref:HTH luxR-type domain-containing protein n=2 Tax=Geoalkalibacter ferrihydriticus TaxID=392333 RepID=A0A0C2HLL6_9BACT|nr:LuxR family transcriptional regulator [Geoalkalibacter ferrihydriticus]KIH78001.1 hypothetical protein GFER_05220 [Geoalkalibacter ferrihydriticus DSM 17813]SDM33391.1 regulatory protein, luxR family [Geoalkalibacter ferrihydriticus]